MVRYQGSRERHPESRVLWHEQELSLGFVMSLKVWGWCRGSATLSHAHGWPLAAAIAANIEDSRMCLRQLTPESRPLRQGCAL